MGVVVVEKSGTGNPTIEGLVAEATVVEEEAEIEEIVCLEEETIAPQCICIARRQGDEWVFYEETGPSANCSEQ
jgi:hypothetical protein